VRWYFAERFVRSLPCVLRCRAFFFDFAVRAFFAMRLRLTTRQSYLCRALTHGIDRMHGSPSFSGSGCNAFAGFG
jgi:hypothetical protein